MSKQPFKQVGGSGKPGLPAVVFAHANGYPPESYGSLLSALKGMGRVWTVEHRPFWTTDAAPTRLKWQCYADDLLETIQFHCDEPVWLIGHSMGAVSGMLAAGKAPSLFRGIVAIDPVLLLDQYYWPSQVITRLRPNSLPIVASALGRPHHFASHEAAFEFYRGKRIFGRISDEDLMAYVASAHAAEEGGGVRLRWSGAWEASVYRSCPRMWGTLSRLKLPTLGLIGSTSNVLDERGVKRWQQAQPHAELLTLDGSHLLPLEDPDRCADLSAEFIHRHAALAATG